MPRNEKWFMYLSNFLTCLSGWVYAWMVYCLKPVNEWDVSNHPWQKHVQSLHILLVPFLIFAVGWIWKQHIQVRLFKYGQPSKKSGWGLITSLILMILSGYLLQVSIEEYYRELYSFIHTISSGVWTLFFIFHVFLEQKKK